MEREQVDIVPDEKRKAAPARPDDASVLAAPEITVMYEHGVGFRLDRGFVKRRRWGHAAPDFRDRLAAFHLQAVWAIIAKSADVEILVEVGGQSVSLHQLSRCLPKKAF